MCTRASPRALQPQETWLVNCRAIQNLHTSMVFTRNDPCKYVQQEEAVSLEANGDGGELLCYGRFLIIGTNVRNRLPKDI